MLKILGCFEPISVVLPDLDEMKSMKAVKLLLLCVICFSVICEPPPTCPANLDGECRTKDSEEWEGEFFPGIPKIKYEVRRLIAVIAFR
ncbi:putative xylose isomerase [Helianthus anomalus]